MSVQIKQDIFYWKTTDSVSSLGLNAMRDSSKDPNKTDIWKVTSWLTPYWDVNATLELTLYIKVRILGYYHWQDRLAMCLLPSLIPNTGQYSCCKGCNCIYSWVQEDIHFDVKQGILFLKIHGLFLDKSKKSQGSWYSGIGWPIWQNRDFDIVHDTVYFFYTNGFTAYFETYVPSDEELETCQ